MIGSLVSLIVILVVVGVLLYVVQLLPIDPKIRLILQIVVALLLVLWLLGFVGVTDYRWPR